MAAKACERCGHVHTDYVEDPNTGAGGFVCTQCDCTWEEGDPE